MTMISASALIEQLSWRYATKQFDPSKKISAETWSALENALILSPSSFGLQPWKFVVIDDPQVRAALRTVSWNQSQITDASRLVVLARRTKITAADVERFAARIAEVRGTPAAAVEEYKNMMLGFVNNPSPGFDLGAWASKQVYIALGVFLASAAVLGVDTCPMEGFTPAEYDRMLKLPEQGFNATVVVTAGYRADDDVFGKLRKVRFEEKDVMAHV